MLFVSMGNKFNTRTWKSQFDDSILLLYMLTMFQDCELFRFFITSTLSGPHNTLCISNHILLFTFYICISYHTNARERERRRERLRNISCKYNKIKCQINISKRERFARKFMISIKVRIKCAFILAFILHSFSMPAKTATTTATAKNQGK